MSISVNLDDTSWLVDVGYGDLFIEPIKIEDGRVKRDWFKFYKINKIEKTNYLLSESREGIGYKKRYQFNLEPRQIEEFQGQCEYKQYSEDSYFVKNQICTIPLKDGRTTILNKKLTKRRDDKRERCEIRTASELNEILKKEFDIQISE